MILLLCALILSIQSKSDSRSVVSMVEHYHSNTRISSEQLMSFLRMKVSVVYTKDFQLLFFENLSILPFV